MKFYLTRRFAILLFAAIAFGGAAGCRTAGGARASKGVRPRAMSDVPSARLAFTFEPDAPFDAPAPTNDFVEAIKKDFDTRRKDDALIRTLPSPDGLRALALYATASTPEGDFRMDVYTADGSIAHPVMPDDLSGAFPQAVAWSPDGGQIAFIGYRTGAAEEKLSKKQTKNLLDPLAKKGSGGPPDLTETPTPAPASLVPTFKTEQIYICDREGYSLRPLTTREGLVYFNIAWSPQSAGLAALACKEPEWDARRAENRAAAGRPRLLTLDGGERLLDDRLTDVAPVWSPDGAKIATAFDTDVMIYDAGPTLLSNAPTAARIPLKDELLASSVKYDAEHRKNDNKANANAKSSGQNAKQTNQAAAQNQTSAASQNAQSNANSSAQQNANASSNTNSSIESAPLSFNPIIRLEWARPDLLLVETGYFRIFRNNEIVLNNQRWHVLHLSPQAELMK